MEVSYIKMDGTGNQFAIIDQRDGIVTLAEKFVQKMASAVGFDQLIVIEPATKNNADCFMRIYNADGGQVEACGNASRCVGWLLMQEGKDAVNIDTLAGVIIAQPAENNQISVQMGQPRVKWQDIPLSEEQDTLHLDIRQGQLYDPVAVSMGNPHAVFFTDDVDAIDFLDNNLGSQLENHPIFPQRANIGVVQIIDRQRIKLRVFERGAGETLACGTGACAAVVAAARRGLIEREKVIVQLRGGELTICWHEDGAVVMTGAVSAPEEKVYSYDA